MTPAEATARQAEQAILGNAMLATTLDLSALEKLNPDQFGDNRHSIIWTAILGELRSGETDAPSLAVIERLKTGGNLELAGGFDYVSNFSQWFIERKLPSLSESLELVAKSAKLRRIGSLAKATADAADGFGQSTASSLAYLRQALDDVDQDSGAGVKNALSSLMDDLSDTFRRGIKTKTPLDDKVELAPGRLYVLGGRPGHGKTTLAIQLAVSVLTANRDAHVFMASSEMTEPELSLKALCCLDGQDHITPLRNVTDGQLTASIQGAVGMYAQILERLHLKTTISMDEISSEAHQLHRSNKLTMLVVDYLSAMQPPGGITYETRTREVGATSGACKMLAQNLDCVVLAASQLRRPTKDTVRPTLRELRDSGEVEQWADSVLLLHRPDHLEDGSIAELLIAKNRWGELGSLELVPDLGNHRFGWRSPRQDDE